MAEGEGFEPPVALRLRLISSQMPLTTQPPFQPGHLFRMVTTPSQAHSLAQRRTIQPRSIRFCTGELLCPYCSVQNDLGHLSGAGSASIAITGAREHNLKNLSLEIPRDKF